jgi:hypothetical protein
MKQRGLLDDTLVTLGRRVRGGHPRRREQMEGIATPMASPCGLQAGGVKKGASRMVRRMTTDIFAQEGQDPHS